MAAGFCNERTNDVETFVCKNFFWPLQKSIGLKLILEVSPINSISYQLILTFMSIKIEKVIPDLEFFNYIFQIILTWPHSFQTSYSWLVNFGR